MECTTSPSASIVRSPPSLDWRRQRGDGDPSKASDDDPILSFACCCRRGPTRQWRRLQERRGRPVWLENVAFPTTKRTRARYSMIRVSDHTLGLPREERRRRRWIPGGMLRRVPRPAGACLIFLPPLSVSRFSSPAGDTGVRVHRWDGDRHRGVVAISFPAGRSLDKKH